MTMKGSIVREYSEVEDLQQPNKDIQ